MIYQDFSVAALPFLYHKTHLLEISPLSIPQIVLKYLQRLFKYTELNIIRLDLFKQCIE